MATRLEEIRNIRLAKLDKLRDLGINPYPAGSRKDYPNQEVLKNFDKYSGKTVTLAGRLISWREHGEIVFGHLADQSGRIQLFIKRRELAPTNGKTQAIGTLDLGLIDVGDFIQAIGVVTKTKSGEISLQVARLSILAKSLRPLPEKWEGLKDPEEVFRRRYLDLVMNPQHREMFARKSKFWASCRQFLRERGFMEVETPVLELVTGGADARPFVTHMNALDQDFYLRISTELYQKRLIGGGYEKIFTFGPNFRNEGMSEEHLPEYYQIEWYWAYADWRANMELVPDLLRAVAREVYGKTRFKRGEHEFDLADQWREIDYVSEIQSQLAVNVFEASIEQMQQALAEHGVRLTGAVNRNRLVDNLWKLIRKDVAGPAFLVNVPKFISPLAKPLAGDERVTERFQVIIAGSELGNGYSELNDPQDQLARFKEQQAARDAGDEEAQMLDIDYVEMLEYGMPPTSGYGQSERVFWTLEGVTAREATLFPPLRRRISETTRRIYQP